MAKTALDEILELSNQPDQPSAQDSGLPSTDTNALEDILGAEQAGGETSMEVPPAPHGMGLDRSAAVGSVAGTSAALLTPPGPWRGAAAGVFGGGAYAADLFSQDLEEGIPLSLDRIGHNLYEGLKFGGTEALAEGIVPFGGMLYNSPPGRAARSWVAKKWGESLLGKHFYDTPSPLGVTPRETDTLIRKGEQKAGQLAGEDRPAAGLTFGQHADEGSAAKNLTAIARQSWFGNAVKRQMTWAAEGAKVMADDVASKMQHMPVEELAKHIDDAVKDNFKTLYAEPASTAYKQLEVEIASHFGNNGRIVNITEQLRELRNPHSKLGDLVKADLRNIREAPLAQGDTAGVAKIDALIDLLDVPKSQGKRAATLALPNIDLDQAIRLKTSINDYANSASPLDDTVTATAKKAAASLAANIDRAITKSLSSAKDILRQYNNAKNDYEAGVTVFKHELVNKVVKQLADRPGALESIILRNDAPIGTITALKDALGPMWNQTIAPKLQAIMVMNTRRPDGTYDGASLAKATLDLIGVNPNKNNPAVAAFGEAGTKNLLTLAKALEETHSPVGSAWWVRMKEAGTIGAIAVGGSAGTGGAVGYALGGGFGAAVGAGLTVLMTPKAIGYLLANENVLKAFKDGITQSSKQGRITPALDFVLTSIRQASAAKFAPVEGHQPAISPDQPSSQAMKASLGGQSVSTLLKPATHGITSEHSSSRK